MNLANMPTRALYDRYLTHSVGHMSYYAFVTCLTREQQELLAA